MATSNAGRTRAVLVRAAVLALVVPGCGAGPGAPRDSGPDGDGDRDADRDAPADAEADAEPRDADADGGDGGGPPAAGPLTFVVVDVALTTERLCDLDGDGDFDNSLADLGSPAAELSVMALNSALAPTVRDEPPQIFHIPWVEDLAGLEDDEIVLIIADCIDGDDPPDPTDDREGGESFWLDPMDLDVCGEPEFPFPDASLHGGRVETGPFHRPLNLFQGIRGSDPRVLGTLAPGALSAAMAVCAVATVRELGAAPGWMTSDDLTMLEVFAAGGAAVGLPLVPGLSLDVDVDHDGLESLLLDADNRIAACVDGDTTVIEGRDCWQDERMADGYSLTALLPSVHARCLGRPPGWEDARPGTCDDPPEESLLDPR